MLTISLRQATSERASSSENDGIYCRTRLYAEYSDPHCLNDNSGNAAHKTRTGVVPFNSALLARQRACQLS
jgi:hypothetical protein